MTLIHQIIFGREDVTEPALIVPETGDVLTYADMARQCGRLADDLEACGAEPGRRIAILLPNSPELAIAVFAVMKTGSIVIPLDAYARKKEILDSLRFIKPDLIITNRNQLRKISPDVVDRSHICMIDFSNTRLDIDHQPPAKSETESTGGDQHSIKPADDALFILTSGSTGTPKAVRLSHSAVLNNIEMHLGSLEIETRIIGLQVLPMNYSYGLIASFLSILHNRGTVVLTSSLEAEKVSAYIDRFEINILMATPTIFRYLFDTLEGKDLMASLRHITIGGDRCPTRLMESVIKRLPRVKAYITYGLSETGPRISTLPPGDFGTRPHSIGLPLKDVEVKILDEEGEECGPNEPGEIVVRTPSMMNGYYRQPEATSDIVRDGWCYTGDLGSKDEDNYLYYSGRNDRVFKLNEKKINPAVIENCICTHPLVEDCQVSRVGDVGTQYLQAEIRIQAPEDLADELKRLCRRELPLYMVPREFKMDQSGDYYFKGRIVKSLRSREVHSDDE